MGQHEVFASVVGGVRLTEPGSDLPMCLAIVSALVDHPLPPDIISFGEIGLAGELRQVTHASRRLAEAARLGFSRAIVPANSANGVDGITLMRVATLSEALRAVGMDVHLSK
jgi:DNA repair protein RadA/Sms